MTKFIVKGTVKYQGKLYASGQVVEVADKDVAEFEKHGWQIAQNVQPTNKPEDNEPKEQDKQDFSKLTVPQLKALLTEKGIKFQENAKKVDLLALLA